MSVVGKHVLTGADVEMTRRLRDGMLLFTVTDNDRNPPNDIVLEIDPRKLKGAFGPRGIVIPPVEEAIITHRECGCPISGQGGTILPCVCSPLIEHTFVPMHEGLLHYRGYPVERCRQCAAPRERHRDRRCAAHNTDPCNECMSRPQIPTNLKHLAKKFTANSPTGRLKFPREPEMQDLPRPRIS